MNSVLNAVLARWNSLDPTTAAEEILPCCGSRVWATELASRRPMMDENQMLTSSDAIWVALPEAAWQEAFESHPRIGQHEAKTASETSLSWSAKEQSAAMSANDEAKLALAEANKRYEERFGRIFIICASGKPANEILGILEARMTNDPVSELHQATEQQRQITQLRLVRWMGGK